ncbi:vWA domain-containing protein [Caldimonas thermodepolymerans]|uniref:vWA domain-containing protein n=1 Tax=Caldimonas thermodepolymerans TaxID=215580 RepID=UPI0022354864|nr:VWA domain-containing protein [Caldimonas thermodepolymerans]UZG44789.1 VWA domain-containing protein [Caldimonas thermodepolymerans]
MITRAAPLGDARSGKLADNLVAFGRALRRAGVPVDSARLALAGEAAALVGVESRADLAAALEATLVSREQDRTVFAELFDAYFRDPKVAAHLLAQMLPRTPGHAEPARRPRVREALSPQAPERGGESSSERQVELDAAMTASEQQRLRHADFNALSADEYRLVERLAREVALPLPEVASRRTQAGTRGPALHWSRTLREAGRNGGELLRLLRRRRRAQPLPLLVLVDVSGSMERYARLLLAFLHAATRGRRRDVFAFGTHLTDLTPAFRLADTDAMLAAANQAIDDFAGGTRLGASLAALRRDHARRLVGGRTLVLLVTDGLDTGEPEALEHELDWLRRHCHRLLWLNPLLRFEGYQPLARGAAALYRKADGMLAVHNLSKLQDLAAALAAVLRTCRT